MKKHILSLFFGLFILFQGLACDKSTAQVLSIVDNSDGTKTYKLQLNVELGGIDSRYLGFLLVFNGLERTPTIKIGNGYNTTKEISNSYGDKLIALTGDLINTYAKTSPYSSNSKEQNFNNYKSFPNAISYEMKDDYYYFSADDFSRIIEITVMGCVKSISFYAHMNNYNDFYRCKKNIDVIPTVISDTLSITAQDSFTWPSSGITYYASGIYKKRFLGNCDLDSTVTLNLTILNKHHSKKDIYLCSGYDYTYKDSTESKNIIQDENHISILKNAAYDKQDSIIQEFVFVKRNDLASKTINVCNGSSYTFPDNTILTNFKNDTTHLVKLVGKAANGCDSTVLYTIYVKSHATATKTYEVGLNKYFYFADNKRIDSVLNDTTRISNIKTKYGCDSIVTQNLIVKESPTISKNSTLCYGEKIYRYNKYLTIVSDTTISYFKGGKYYYSPDTIVVETIKLNKPRTLTEVSDKICALKNYSSSYGFNINAIKRDTILVKRVGVLDTNSCYDSIIKIAVKVIPSHTFTKNYQICYNESFTFNDGTYIDSVKNYQSHTSKYTNIFGCDSLIIENISTYPNYILNKNFSLCVNEKHTCQDGKIIIMPEKDTVYRSIFKSKISGCDSLVLENLKLINSRLYNTYKTICYGSNYTFLDGKIVNNIIDTLSHKNVYPIPNKCDSVVVEFLSVNKPTATISVMSDRFVLNDWNVNSNYQWYDCNTDQPLDGETTKTLIYSKPGSYRIEYTRDSCHFASSCYQVKTSGLETITQKQISIYPNPTTGKIVISSPENNIKSIRITTIEGKLVDEISAIQSSEFSYELTNSSSVYLVKIETEKGLEIHRVIRE